ITHFIETCNNAKTYEYSMVKQFVRSLKGASFDWYTDLSIGSINSWDQLEQEFFTCFYSIRRTIASSIDMCVQGIHWGLLYCIKSYMSFSFEELVTRAHDLEL
ncbi:hypothetical protein CFOL_v3_23639, partial [Cephalotus follicularis]